MSPKNVEWLAGRERADGTRIRLEDIHYQRGYVCGYDRGMAESKQMIAKLKAFVASKPCCCYADRVCDRCEALKTGG